MNIYGFVNHPLYCLSLSFPHSSLLCLSKSPHTISPIVPKYHLYPDIHLSRLPLLSMVPFSLLVSEIP